MKVLLATGNKGKIKELKCLIEFSGLKIELVGLSDMEKAIEVDEPYMSFYENAVHKAKSYSRFYGLPVIADDSGLVVPALNYEPGVYSARYAGENASDADNIELLLKNMKTVEDKEAYFECNVVFYISDAQFVLTSGQCYGTITDEPVGENGFGYDPVFYVPAKNKTMAELTMEEKNSISHRKQAFGKMLTKLAEKGWIA